MNRNNKLSKGKLSNHQFFLKKRLMNKRDISPDNFYGDSSEAPSWRDQLKKRKIQHEEQRHLKIFKFFYKQENALQFLKDSPLKEKLYAFSFENETFLLNQFSLKTTQQRIFLISSLDTFWKEYQSIPKKYHHFYEIIPYFNACNLYLDCEFIIKENINLNGEEMIQILIEELKIYLKNKFELILKNDLIYDLDSTSNLKFSRHLILHLVDKKSKKFAFKDNRQLGLFMKQFLIFLEEKHPNFKVNKENSEEKTSFVDPAVYTKNRSFRLFQSTKKGKESFLNISKSNKSIYLNDKEFFINSLCVCKSYDELITMDDLEIVQPIERKLKNSEEFENLDDLNEFVEKLISDGRDINVGNISQVSNLEGKKIIYNIKNYRYCENIKRPHKSNNIYFVVDIDRNCIFQKCYDPDCKDFRSIEIRLPTKIIESLKLKKISILEDLKIDK